MDRERVRDELNAHLLGLASRRRTALSEAEDLSSQIGATAFFLRDELGQSKAESARLVDLSPSHMTEWMKSAVDRGVTLGYDPFKRISILAGQDLQSFVAAHGGVVRIVTSFADHDVLYMSQVDPSRLIHEGHVFKAHMMICTDDESWVAVRDVSVGYGGTGPSNAYRELRGIGVDEDLSSRIAAARVSDVTLAHEAEGLHSNEWPHLPLHNPTPVGSWFAVPVVHDPTVFDDGRTTSKGQERSALPPWLEYLDQPQNSLPSWLRGARRVRVYLDLAAAHADGFTVGTLNPRAANQGRYPLIVEQGRLQVWVKIPLSTDPTVLFTKEIHDALALAGFYTDSQRALDNQGAFRRWLRSLGATRPPYVDLDPQLPIQLLPNA